MIYNKMGGMRRLLTGYRELGIPLAEIARLVGIGTSGVAMAVKGMNEKTNLNEMNAVPSDVPEKSSKGLNSSRKRGYLKSDPAVRPGRKDGGFYPTKEI